MTTNAKQIAANRGSHYLTHASKMLPILTSKLEKSPNEPICSGGHQKKAKVPKTNPFASGYEGRSDCTRSAQTHLHPPINGFVAIYGISPFMGNPKISPSEGRGGRVARRGYWSCL